MTVARPKLWLAALDQGLGRAAAQEWFAGPLHAAALGRRKTEGFAASPHDLRPVDPTRGQALLNGEFVFAGQTLSLGLGGDPWNRPSPSLTFAEQLHGFDWIGDLIALGAPGITEALRLALEWRRTFGRWNAFAWRADVLERRVFNLACHARALAAPASELEASRIADTLARQARHLLALGDAPPRAAERLAAAALAGTGLAGAAGGRLLARALPRLEAALALAVRPDGGHASRSPQAGLELLFDLLALDDGLSQLGRPPAARVSQAIDRLTAALRFFTLPDGRLAAFQGGEASDAPRIAAALAPYANAQDNGAAKASPLTEAPYSGYQRLSAPGLTVMLDAGPPARGAWSLTACGQPGAIAVLAGRERLIDASGWSALAGDAAQPLRLAAGGSTAALGEGVVGWPLSGALRKALGPRLEDGAAHIEVHRHEDEAGAWVEVSHGGWLASAGLTHERRLFLDKSLNELRGEDRFIPAEAAQPRPVAVAIRFHLHPGVRAQLARDQRSVLLRGYASAGWWLRNDASEVAVEPAIAHQDGLPINTLQIVLRGRLRADRGGRVRWKLAAAVEAH